jgi:hypothetical protein
MSREQPLNTKEEIIEMLNDRIIRWGELVKVSKEPTVVNNEWKARISELETVRDLILPKSQIEEED